MSDMFEQFWKRCPDRGPATKGGKPAALKAFTKALEKTSFADMIRAVEKWRQSESGKRGNDRTTVPMVTTWLNQGYYLTILEDLDLVQKPTKKPAQPRSPKITQRQAMESEMGQLAISNGAGANFWLQCMRRNENPRLGNPFDFVSDKGGEASRYIRKQVEARENVKHLGLQDNPMVGMLRGVYKTMLERERAFMDRYGSA